MTSLLPSSTGGRHGAQRSGSTNLNVINLNTIDISESIDLILLIAICIVMLAIHIIAYAHIHFGENGDEQISLAIVRDIIVVIIYLFLKYIIINL